MSKKLTNKTKKSSAKAAPKASPRASESIVPFSIDSLGELCQFLKTNGIAEFQWSKGDHQITLKTGMASGVQMFSAPPQTYMQAPAQAAPAPSQDAAATASTAEPASHKKVNSPFVGTFYRSPSPTAPSYAEVGQKVKAGDTLCIVEAMKLMNEIEADFAGKVVQVLVENGQPVEFGEPLFVIDTAL
jgi:acetyl-CoA carboxylase biotin carboxyl carrier protein